MLEYLINIIESDDEIMEILGDNLFVNRIPFESTLPAMMLQIISSSSVTSKDMFRIQDTAIVDFNIFAEDYETLQTLLDELRSLFINYNFNSCPIIKEVQYEGESDMYEENKNIMMKTVSYSVIY